MEKLCIFENYKSSRARNLVAQRVVSCLKNALKLTYMHLQFQNFSGVIPRTPLKRGRGGMGRGLGGRGGEGKGRREKLRA
jgi:hypothetical protein